MDDFGGLAEGNFPEAQLAEENLLGGGGLAAPGAAGHEAAPGRVEGVSRRGGHGQQTAAARAHPAGGAARGVGRQARTGVVRGHPESVDGS